MSPGAFGTPRSSAKKRKQQENGLAPVPEAPTPAPAEGSRGILDALEDFMVKQAEQVERASRANAVTPGAQAILRLWDTFYPKTKQDISEQAKKLQGDRKGAFLKRAQELIKQVQDLKLKIQSALELPVA